MKKRGVWFLTTLLLVSTACSNSAQDAQTGSQQGSGEKVKLTLMNRWAEDPQKSYFDHVIKEFEAQNPNIDISAENIPEEAYKSKIKVVLGSNKVPDIYYSWSGEFAHDFVRAEKALDLSPYLAADTNWSNGLYKSQLGPFTFDNKVYGVPISMDQKIFYYNKEIFQKLGLQAPETWDQFIQVVETIKNSGVTPIAFGNKDPWAVAHYLTTLNQKMVPEDVRLKDYNPATGSFTDEGYVRALERLKEIVQYANPDPNALSYDFGKQMFIDGKAAITYEQISQIKLYNSDFEIGIFDFPQIPDAKGNPNYITGAPQGYLIYSTTKHPQEAVEFLKFLTSKEMGHKLVEDTGLISAVQGAVDDRNATPVQLDSVNQIKVAENTVLWLDTAIDIRIVNEYLRGAQLMLNGDKTPQEVMAAVQKKAAEVKASSQ